jgi:hypothetical protein
MFGGREKLLRSSWFTCTWYLAPIIPASPEFQPKVTLPFWCALATAYMSSSSKGTENGLLRIMSREKGHILKNLFHLNFLSLFFSRLSLLLTLVLSYSDPSPIFLLFPPPFLCPFGSPIHPGFCNMSKISSKERASCKFAMLTRNRIITSFC